MIVFEDVLKLLSENGWSTYRLQKEHMISNGTIVRLRKKQSVSTDTLNTICRLCQCQPCDIIHYADDGKKEQE